MTNRKWIETVERVTFLTLAVISMAPGVRGDITYDFNGNSLQGWHNRVWDTHANSSAGAWVDLDTNVTTLPGDINGGVIVPADSGDTLFVSTAANWPYEIGGGSYLTPGNLDAGLNTKWARSPEFYLTGSGDLTFSLIWGKATGTLPQYDSGVAYDASQGWSGLALRDATTGRFVLSQSGTENFTAYTPFSFTSSQLADLDRSHRYTLDLITTKAASASWISLDNVSIPGVPAPVDTITYTFNGNTLQGWHNRVWDAAAGAWTDLAANATAMPSTINGGVIVPADSGNTLFVSTSANWPQDVGGESYLTPGNLDAGLNTKWVRSPEFYLTGSGDLTFGLIWGLASGALPALDSEVAYDASQGWSGLALRDATTGMFVLSQSGSTNYWAYTPFSFTSNQLAHLDPSHRYTLDLITTKAAFASWISLDNVSVPGVLAPADKYMLTFSFGPLGSVPVAGAMAKDVPRGTDVTKLAPTFTLAEGASCVPASGTVLDFTAPQTYTVTAADASKQAYVVTVSHYSDALSVTSGLVFRVRADVGVGVSGTNVMQWSDMVAGNHLTPVVATGYPSLAKAVTPNGSPAIHFDGPLTRQGVAGQALCHMGTAGLPTGTADRTVFLFGQYNYASRPSHDWGGFAYGSTSEQQCFGLVTQEDSDSLAIQGWGGGHDYVASPAVSGDTWMSQSVTLTGTGANQTFYHYKNGQQIDVQQNMGYSTGTNLMVLGVELDKTGFQQMDVAEVLIYDRVLTSDERAQVETYFAKTWMYKTGTLITVR